MRRFDSHTYLFTGVDRTDSVLLEYMLIDLFEPRRLRVTPFLSMHKKADCLTVH